MNREAYNQECSARWHGPALSNAKANWHAFAEMHDELAEAMRTFRRDPFQSDLQERCCNPNGTLTGYLWFLQQAIEPDRSRLYPLTDFCEHHQKVHLRRGLIIYCVQILRDMEAESVPVPAQATLLDLPPS